MIYDSRNLRRVRNGKRYASVFFTNGKIVVRLSSKLERDMGVWKACDLSYDSEKNELSIYPSLEGRTAMSRGLGGFYISVGSFFYYCDLKVRPARYAAKIDKDGVVRVDFNSCVGELQARRGKNDSKR